MSFALFSKGACCICGRNVGGLLNVKVTPFAGGYWICHNRDCNAIVCMGCESKLKVGLLLKRICPRCGHKMKRVGRWEIL